EGALVLVLYAVHREQVDDVSLLEADPAELHPADLRVRAADRVAGVGAGDLRGLTQAAELGAEHDPSGRRRTADVVRSGRGDFLRATARVVRDHRCLPCSIRGHRRTTPSTRSRQGGGVAPPANRRTRDRRTPPRPRRRGGVPSTYAVTSESPYTARISFTGWNQVSPPLPQLPQPPEVTPWAWSPVMYEPPESPGSAHTLVFVIWCTAPCA